MAKQIA